ncbi:unnamed protein product [Durusdinium trenchii]|uniref:Uncharacterized protein n=1 Tax=Durusdinium trenchii TaxID=1381693 RepID=A0ABP0IVD3_9DINO
MRETRGGQCCGTKDLGPLHPRDLGFATGFRPRPATLRRGCPTADDVPEELVEIVQLYAKRLRIWEVVLVWLPNRDQLCSQCPLGSKGLTAVPSPVAVARRAAMAGAPGQVGNLTALGRASKIFGVVCTGTMALGFYWFAKPRFEAMLLPPPAPVKRLRWSDLLRYLDEDFSASKAFAGERPGWVFKLDHRGLGYYRDGRPQEE